MQLFWHGYSSVRIEGRMGESEVTILTDPFESEASVRFPRTVSPDILVLSHQDRSTFNLEGAQGTPFIISDPGEYEVKGAFVVGIQNPSVDPGTAERPVIYRFMLEGMSVGFLGQLKRKLTEHEIEALENIDILLVPVGGGDVMDPKLASETIAEIEPRIVVPLHYDIPGIKAKLSGVDAFCKQLGVCKRQDINKLKITKKDLPTEDVLITVLERA
jgi:L-ascorbate metabolism protein UlaG (beta-lactamase superfamily)